MESSKMCCILPVLVIQFTLKIVLRNNFMFSVGNKNDCPDRKVVLYEDAKRFADQMNISLFETSAKDNINVEEVSLSCGCGSHMQGNSWVMSFVTLFTLSPP